MKRQFNLASAAVLSVVLVCSASALAGGVQVRFNVQNAQATPFPSDLFSIDDSGQNTGLRVDLPFPDCRRQVSDCELIEFINTLDGFNLQPRLSIPFTGSIDVETVTSETVFLIHLGSTLAHNDDDAGKVIGINQVVWDPKAKTLHVESDVFLDQHTRYALIVTRGVRDLDGVPISSQAFERFRRKLASEPEFSTYRQALELSLRTTREAGILNKDIAAASVFTTQSITSFLEKARDQIKAATPEPANFQLGFDGSRTVFPLKDLTHIIARHQVGTNAFEDIPLAREELEQLRISPDVVSAIAFGSYRSPNYQTKKSGTSHLFIPPIATRTGTPRVFGNKEVFFNLFLPAGDKPDSGWPVVIYGHGSGPGKDFDTFFIAATLADYGLATIAINAVGHGGGQGGKMIVRQAGGDTVTLPAGGRGVDLNNDGVIGGGGHQEGFAFNGFSSFSTDVLFANHGHRQRVVDFMQLVRVIEVGVDVDNDGAADLDPSQLYYVGYSIGGDSGALFLAVEPSVSAGILNVVNASTVHYRLSPANRPNFNIALASLTPPLINVGNPNSCEDDKIDCDLRFDENLPLRNQSPVINEIPGAIAIQAFIDKVEWIDQSGSPVSYAVHLRKKSLAGVPPKSILIQFARGDRLVPNPGTTALLGAGDLMDRATFYRHDLVFNDPTHDDVPEEPHGFMMGIGVPPEPLDLPDFLLEIISLPAQQQIAEFFASGGTLMIDPDGAEPFFEVPIAPPLPEDCGYVVEIPDFKACQ